MRYFAMLHNDKYCTLLGFRQKAFAAQHMPIVLQQNHCVLQQKILAIGKTVIASMPQNIGFMQYQRRTRKLVLMQPIFCGIDAIADNYCYYQAIVPLRFTQKGQPYPIWYSVGLFSAIVLDCSQITLEPDHSFVIIIDMGILLVI